MTCVQLQSLCLKEEGNLGQSHLTHQEWLVS